MELLNLVRQDHVLDQAEGEEAPGALLTTTGKLAPSASSYAAHTTFVKQLHRQKLGNLQHNIIKGNCFKDL